MHAKARARNKSGLVESTLGKLILFVAFLLVFLIIILVWAWPKLKDALESAGWL